MHATPKNIAANYTERAQRERDTCTQYKSPVGDTLGHAYLA